MDASTNTEQSTTIDLELPQLPIPDYTGGTPSACLIQIHPVVGRCGVRYLSDNTIIGRDTEADYQIKLESVSRQHAKIQRLDDGRYRLTDLGSTNGTFVNDVEVREWDLEGNDQIRCGGAVLKVLPADDLEAQYHEVAYMMMTHDSLTGVFNRQYFDDMLGREVVAAKRYNRPLAVLMMDLDHFKAINDLHGHLAGDEVLREFARRVDVALRTESIFARTGGEEFGIILKEANAQEAKIAAERIREAVAMRKFEVRGARIAVSISIGVATTEGQESINVAQLLAEADANLYEAKRQGRDRVCSPMETQQLV